MDSLKELSTKLVSADREVQFLDRAVQEQNPLSQQSLALLKVDNASLRDGEVC